MLDAAAAHATRSWRCLGRSTPFGTPPTPWHARPMRCSPEATLSGASSCTTRSTSPMSIPSSRDDVATMARSSPRFRRDSRTARFSRAREPWWARAVSSPVMSFTAVAMRSAMRRLFTKTIVDRCARTRSAMRAWRPGQALLRREPSPSSPSVFGSSASGAGTGSTTRCKVFRAPASTMATGRGVLPSKPPSKRATSSSGRWVALRPMRCSRGASRGRSASSRSRETARCTPRLVGTSAWISSTITVSTVASVSRAADVSIR